MDRIWWENIAHVYNGMPSWLGVGEIVHSLKVCLRGGGWLSDFLYKYILYKIKSI